MEEDSDGEWERRKEEEEEMKDEGGRKMVH